MRFSSRGLSAPYTVRLMSGQGITPGTMTPWLQEEREQVAACAMAVRVLDKCNVMIHPGSIQRVVDAARHG